MVSVGSAFVSILPSARGFGPKLDSEVGGELGKSGKRSGGLFSKAFVAAGVVGVAAGVAGFAKKAIGLEASFSKTMNVLAATTNAPQREMKELNALAIQMGKDTVFSAGDAGDAMLELARGGLSAATIQAGALKGTMTLAAAGQLELGESANLIVKSMGQFNLKGGQASSVASALAGAANASSASVGDMGIALSQAGLSANAVGFSLQETTGILAAFSNKGLEGSDAGTSLKTMLSALQPQTASAKKAFKALNLVTADGTNRLINANGTFKSAAEVAGLLKKGTEGLTKADKARQIRLAFGSDAQRAATILATEGAAGIKKYTKATSDQGAAQKQAAANMKGTAGALESLKGSLETLTLRFGQLIAPGVQAGMRLLTDLINGVEPAVGRLLASLSSGGTGLTAMGAELTKTGAAVKAFVMALLPTIMRLGTQLMAVLGPGLKQIGALITTQLLPAFRKMLPVLVPVAKFLIRVIGGAVIGAVKGAIQFIKGIVNVIAGVFKLVTALVTGDWRGAWKALKQIFFGAINAVLGAFKVWMNVGILGIFKGGILKLLGAWKGLWSGIKSLGTKALTGTKNLVVAGLKRLVDLFKGLGGRVVAAMSGLKATLFKKGKELVSGLIEGIKGMAGKLASFVKDFVTKHIPGPVAKALGIASPSRVMAEQAKHIPGGMIEGIESQSGKVDKAMTRLSSRISLTPPKLDPALTTGTRGGQGGPLFTVEKVEAQNVNHFLREMQQRSRAVSGGGVAFG